MSKRRQPSRVGSSFPLLVAALVFLVLVLLGRNGHAAALAITPPSATVAPLGTQAFTASGGSGMGYVFSLSVNNSGGNITAAGAYTAGATGGVIDTVQLVDSAADMTTAAVTVGAGVTVAPATATVAAGGMQTFVASGGMAPYTWALTTDGSGALASVTAMGGVYTAGAMAGTDVVTATDSLGNTGTATITVTVMMTMTVGIGASCTTTAMCPTGATCVDGVCCTSACTGQCQACFTADDAGTCVTITGPPIGMRPACPQSDPSNVCTMKVCDGTSPTACTSYVGTSTICGVASCTDGVGTPGAICEGDGGCQKVAPKSCGAYACVSDQCATSCTDSSECSPGNYCNVNTGKCVVQPPLSDSGVVGGADASGPMTETASGGCSLQGRSAGPRIAMVVASLFGLMALVRLRRSQRRRRR